MRTEPSQRVLVHARYVVALGIAAITLAACTRETTAVERYQPRTEVTGILRSWGSEHMAALMEEWQRGFRQHHPTMQFANTLKGSEIAQAGLYTGVADLAPMGYEYYGTDKYPLFRRKGHFPLAIEVATGSYDVPERTCALAVFVHKDNPIAGLTLAQLDGMFGEQRSGGWDESFQWHTERGRTAANNIRNWGQLGLIDEWASLPVRVHGYSPSVFEAPGKMPGAAYFFQNAVLQGADKWNGELLEYADGKHLAAELGKDRGGVGFGCMSFMTAQLKAVPVAANNTDYVALTKEHVAARHYPLSRPVYIYIDRTPGQPIDPKVDEFLRYVLSDAGQSAVGKQGHYLPLPAARRQIELGKLD